MGFDHEFLPRGKRDRTAPHVAYEALPIDLHAGGPTVGGGVAEPHRGGEVLREAYVPRVILLPRGSGLTAGIVAGDRLALARTLRVRKPLHEGPCHGVRNLGLDGLSAFRARERKLLAVAVNHRFNRLRLTVLTFGRKRGVCSGHAHGGDVNLADDLRCRGEVRSEHIVNGLFLELRVRVVPVTRDRAEGTRGISDVAQIGAQRDVGVRRIDRELGGVENAHGAVDVSAGVLKTPPRARAPATFLEAVRREVVERVRAARHGVPDRAAVAQECRENEWLEG